TRSLRLLDRTPKNLIATGRFRCRHPVEVVDVDQRVLDLDIIRHLAVPVNAPASSPGRRFVRSAGYRVSQVVRKRIEEIFGWGKSVAGLRRTKLRGRYRTWDGSYLIMAAYNLTRMTRLLNR